MGGSGRDHNLLRCQVVIYATLISHGPATSTIFKVYQSRHVILASHHNRAWHHYEHKKCCKRVVSLDLLKMHIIKWANWVIRFLTKNLHYYSENENSFLRELVITPLLLTTHHVGKLWYKLCHFMWHWYYSYIYIYIYIHIYLYILHYLFIIEHQIWSPKMILEDITKMFA